MRFGAAVVLLAGLLVGCESARPGLTIQARSKDGRVSYAIDADQGSLVAYTKNGRKVAEVPVGRAPEQLTVGPDDRVYVANRGSRSVSIIARDGWAEVARVQVGPEPVALAVAADNQTLYVVNGTSFASPDEGTLTAIALDTLATRWTMPLGSSPRSISLVDARTAEVGFGKNGETARIDLTRGRVVHTVAQVDTSTAGTTF
jgi:YVTN family beta-propeller protein